MTSDLRVDTRPLRVELYFGPGHTLRGDVFLHGTAKDHGGEENLVDLLVDPAPFFPLRVEGVDGKRTVLVAKGQIRYVAAPPLDADRRIAASRMAAVPVQVELQLDDTETVRGILHVEGPLGQQRTLDLVNGAASAFFPLAQKDRDLVVNRAHVQYVRDVGDG